MYVAYTYDGGASWTTTDATPNDPVQRGCVELIFATSKCSHRNLLDFNDMTVDKTGRALVAYADGCTGKCVASTASADNRYSAVGTIARQACGKGLFAAYDGLFSTCEAAAAASQSPSSAPLPNTTRAGGSAAWSALGVGLLILAVTAGWSRRRAAARRAARCLPRRHERVR
jgi:hypothetical protein